MKIFMVGEAANHSQKLSAELDPDLRDNAEIVELPREAAQSDAFDAEIGPDDVLISLRLGRSGADLPAVRLLHVPGAGLDAIDMDALSPATTVCNVFEHESPIAEFVLASVLQWEIRFDALRRSFSPERWPDLYRNRVPHGEARGKTLGLIGYGRIGRAIAALAGAFGMKVAALDPGLAEDEPGVRRARDIDELVAAADYLVVACPLTDATRGMVGAAELAKLEPSAVLINISRAEVVDEEALFEALRSERIRGASLDVWYRYPVTATDAPEPSRFPFHTLGNAICTPHSCAWTTELTERRYAVIARNINAIVAGRPLENVVREGARRAAADN